MELNTLLYIAAILSIAYMVRVLCEALHIPMVTGYVIVGVLLGTSAFHFLDEKSFVHLEMVPEFALSIIAFIIGVELNHNVIKKLGRSILFIAFFESFGAFLLVFAALQIFFPNKLYMNLLLSAVASATAPAATVAVIRQYNSRGPLTSTILAVVGIDDGVALIIYVFASGFAMSFLSKSHVSILMLALTPIVKILLSGILGFSIGILYYVIFKKIRYNDELAMGIVAGIFLVMGSAKMLHLSDLLSVMVFGSTIVNKDKMLANRSMKIVEAFSPVILPIFFIYAGAHLNINSISVIGGMSVVFLLARISGKIAGASLGAIIGKASKNVRKYIGFGLIPQVGVAIALALAIKKDFTVEKFGPIAGELSTTIINVLLLTTIFTEIAGPLMTGYAITKAGEKNVSEV